MNNFFLSKPRLTVNCDLNATILKTGRVYIKIHWKIFNNRRGAKPSRQIGDELEEMLWNRSKKPAGRSVKLCLRLPLEKTKLLIIETSWSFKNLCFFIQNCCAVSKHLSQDRSTINKAHKKDFKNDH